MLPSEHQPTALGKEGQSFSEGAGRQMHVSLAGVLSPGRMQSFKLESHWVFERTNVGSGKEVFNRTHISVQDSWTIPSPSQF